LNLRRRIEAPDGWLDGNQDQIWCHRLKILFYDKIVVQIEGKIRLYKSDGPSVPWECIECFL